VCGSDFFHSYSAPVFQKSVTLIKQNLSIPAPVNSCVTIPVDCEYVFKSLKHSAKNHSCSGSCSNQKYPILVLLRLLLKKPTLAGVDSCTPDPTHLWYKVGLLYVVTGKIITLSNSLITQAKSSSFTELKTVYFFTELANFQGRSQGARATNRNVVSSFLAEFLLRYA